MQSELSSADQVIEALGGIQALMDLTGRKYSAVHHWRSCGSFPSSTYLILTTELHRKGLTASPSLWRMRQPEPAQ
jgi:hypothetical protein